MSDWLLPSELDVSTNAFRDKFGNLSPDAWCDVLIESINSPIIDGLEFLHFPPSELQDGTHGSSGETALREAAEFYKFVASHEFFPRKAVSGTNFLDFGTGWGRIARLFLRDFDLDGFFAFEPHHTSSYRTRLLNPYLCVFTGGELPDQKLPGQCFDVVVGWSVFSHLSEHSTAAWLEELARVTRKDGYCVFSAFGARFLDDLVARHADLKAGREIHWYHKACLDAAGDILEHKRRYARGEFAWLPLSPNSHYGMATFLHEKALLNIISTRRLPFELIEFDRETVNMDVFVLHRR
jgi:ubiquinone/menaquinone biosynthesis C-methylase UbiE